MTKRIKKIKFKKLVKNAELPVYAHDGDIGMDVKAVSLEYDRINDVYIYGTGLACETTGHMGILGMMKSGIYKHGDCYLTNGVGLIDSDQYRGEIKYIYRSSVPLYIRAKIMALSIWNNSSIWYKLTHKFDDVFEETRNDWNEFALSMAPYKTGEVCGQLVPLTFDKVEIQEVDELTETERGKNGFGSGSKSPKKYKGKTKEK